MIDPVLQPLIQQAEEAAVTLGGIALSAFAAWAALKLNTVFKIQNGSAVQMAEAAAVTKLNAALPTVEGQLIARIKAGALDPTNPISIRANAVDLAASLQAKLPGAMTVLQPAAGAMVDKVEALVHTSPAVNAVINAMVPTAVNAAVGALQRVDVAGLAAKGVTAPPPAAP